MVLSLYGWLIAVVSLAFYPDHNINSSRKFHPFYISVTEMNHNAKNNIVEISCKIFADDLEKVLSRSAGGKVNVSDPNNKSNNDKLISTYIAKHLQLKIDDKPVTIQFIGSEREEDVVWSYFQVNNISAVKKIDVMNDILYETFESQTNLIHVQVDGNRQSKKVTNPESRLTFEY